MLQTLRNAWKIPDLRKKILYTVLLIVVFRFGSYIPVPWIDASAVASWLNNETGNTLFNLMDSFSGGSLSNATIFAMSISPYINSSIIMQLLTVAIPALERMAKEGAEGRKKITKITRYVTVVLAAVQALGLYLTLRSQNAIMLGAMPEIFIALSIIFAFTAGTAFLMWLGEQITGKGIGNGISMIIFAGIVASVPNMIRTAAENFGAWWNWVLLLVYVLLSITFVVLINDAERKIPVQYAKRVVGNKMYGGQSSNIPIKVTQGGVIPIIFAMSIMTFPATLAQIIAQNDYNSVLYTIANFVTSGWFYPTFYFILIIAFAYFYASITFNPIEIANNIKSNGGAIMGIRPGKPTSDYIAKVVSKITLIGAIALAVIAVLPIVVTAVIGMQVASLALTGTSLLIVVGVALETVQQIEAQMVMRHYKGFLE
ncbi:MAG: preprotein translocase subunit SecY [Clostridia bacterium]